MRGSSVSDQGSFRTFSVSSVLLFLSVVGCATIRENVTLVIESRPSGANVTSSEGWECSTPCKRNVPRDSRFDVKLVRPGYRSVAQTVEIPELKPSPIGTYIGAGIGVMSGITAVDFLESFTTFFLFSTETIELSTGSKFKIIGYGTLVYGGLGFGIDRLWDDARAKRPVRIEVTMGRSAENVDTHE